MTASHFARPSASRPRTPSRAPGARCRVPHPSAKCADIFLAPRPVERAKGDKKFPDFGVRWHEVVAKWRGTGGCLSVFLSSGVCQIFAHM